MKSSVFQIRKNPDGEYYATLSATNGQIIATTPLSKSQSGVLNMIESIRLNSISSEIIKYID